MEEYILHKYNVHICLMEYIFAADDWKTVICGEIEAEVEGFLNSGASLQVILGILYTYFRPQKIKYQYPANVR